MQGTAPTCVAYPLLAGVLPGKVTNTDYMIAPPAEMDLRCSTALERIDRVNATCSQRIQWEIRQMVRAQPLSEAGYERTSNDQVRRGLCR